jgi:hypothetical protein
VSARRGRFGASVSGFTACGAGGWVCDELMVAGSLVEDAATRERGGGCGASAH